MTTILAILASLFGACNIFQLIFLRSTKKRYEAETHRTEIDTEQARTDLHQDQYDYVSQQLSRIQQEYYDLAERFREAMTEHLNEVDGKCREIAELKSKLMYFKGLRCYCSDCDKRVTESPYKDHLIDKGNEIQTQL